jgi:RNA polymerase sigma factor (TIGR02999 family)
MSRASLALHFTDSRFARSLLALLPMKAVTHILSAIEQGDSRAIDQLMPLIYEDLHKLAAARMAHEKPGQTLQTTALVHEAYVRLVDQKKIQRWESRGHFFAAAAEAMRRILIERARHKATDKRGGGARRLDLEHLTLGCEDRPVELLALDESLGELEHHDPQIARLVKLRYFAGLSHQEAALALGITRRAADRLWAVARAWLYQRLAEA